MKLATFDIFDTALIRKCGRPETALRMIELLNVDEMEFERGNLTANPAIKDIIGQKRKEGFTIKFLSDMYLPSYFLAEILKREGCMEDREEVIVSCEHDARKDLGTLYDLVRTKYNPTEWIHYGDNRQSDVKMAKRKCVKSVWVDTTYTGIERRLLEKSKTLNNGWQLALLAGISRTARILAGNTPEAILAADYVVPTYLPYVMYVLRESRKRGVNRLHFLSRDGYILYKIAEALSIESISLNYLFASRRSLMSAYLYHADKKDYMAIVDRHTLIKREVNHLLWQLLTTREEMQEKYGIEFAYKKITTREEEEDFLNKIFSHNQFTADFVTKCAKNKQLTIEYFLQEQVAGKDGMKSAMVDIGWLGTSRLMMNRILKDSGFNQVPTFYMGIRRDVFPQDYGAYIPYYNAGKLDTNATALIESYFSASPWPTTIGYDKNNEGKIEPIFPLQDEYCENEITKTNVFIARQMVGLMKQTVEIDADILDLWSSESISNIASLSCQVNISPLAEINKIDTTYPLIKQMSGMELIHMLFFGKQVSEFDKGSLVYTLGFHCGKLLYPLHCLSRKLRGWIYQKYLAK